MRVFIRYCTQTVRHEKEPIETDFDNWLTPIKAQSLDDRPAGAGDRAP
eukprot:SAG25_NODE_2787_length_1383_cov_5.013495_3_plen_47_part_01